MVRQEPDCVKTRLFLVPWGTVAEKRPESSRVPYCALTCDTKWDACPFAFRNLDFSHSLEHRAYHQEPVPTGNQYRLNPAI